MVYRALIATSIEAFVLASPANACPDTESLGPWFDEMLQRNLFGLPVQQGGCTMPSKVSTLPFKLVGTLKADPPELSSALIADPDRELPKAYSIGDTLHGREVVSIDTDRIALRGQEGTLEYLVMAP